MLNQSFKILSIKPGTKCLGVAVLDSGDLVYWKNKVARGKKLPTSQVLKKVRTITNKLIDFWSPQVIAIESIFYVQAKTNRLLNSLTKEIKEIGKENGLKVYSFSPLLARKFICQKEKPNKLNTARILATNYYPWLYKDYKKENTKPWWKAKYKLRVFDAIAIGLFCFHGLKTKRSTSLRSGDGGSKV